MATRAGPAFAKAGTCVAERDKYRQPARPSAKSPKPLKRDTHLHAPLWSCVQVTRSRFTEKRAVHAWIELALALGIRFSSSCDCRRRCPAAGDVEEQVVAGLCAQEHSSAARGEALRAAGSDAVVAVFRYVGQWVHVQFVHAMSFCSSGMSRLL